MKNKGIQNLFSTMLIIGGFVAIFALSNFIEKVRPPLPEGYEDQELALQGAKLKDFSLGMNGLFADWYWMQSLQYIGDKIARSPDVRIDLENLRPINPRLLYPLLDNATSLDPQYLTAYSYGAIVLPAIDPEQAIKIAQKGIDNNPNEWRLYQHLGYIYWRLKNYEKAAETYEKGSKIKGAPSFLQMLAAQMKSRGTSREIARQIYQQMYAEAQDTQTRENATRNLLGLDAKDELDKINSVLQAIKENSGRCPQNWREVFPVLRTQKIANGLPLRFDTATNSPVDPTNIPYFLNNIGNVCQGEIDRMKSKIPTE